MKITTRITFDIETWAILEHEWYEYDGPVARCDRAASAEAKKAEQTAATTAGQESANAAQARGLLTPFYRGEMMAQHAVTPQQQQELMTAAEAPLAASAATTAGQAASQAARTRNTAGFSPALDQAARERQQALGTASGQIAAQDVLGAKQMQQEGAAGMAGLYGQDTDAMLKAMGQESQDINAQIEAGKSGWLQNSMAVLNTLSNAGSSAAGAYKDLYGGGGGK